MKYTLLYLNTYLPLNTLSALSFIFNRSLSQGKFISTFKHAKIILIYKKENAKIVTNYWPIILLSNISIIIEKICLQPHIFFLIASTFF